MGELVAPLRTNDPDALKDLLSADIQKFGVTEVNEMLLDWLYTFLKAEEQPRHTGWHLGVSL